jgi:CTP:molybdopterin cytidylyltransferase MocA
MNFPVGILGAGLGSRMASKAKAKPLALLKGETILSRLLGQLERAGAKPIYCALRDELLTEEDRRQLPKQESIHYCFVNTPSSLHTLIALAREMKTMDQPILFLMADSVLLDEDLEKFVTYCRSLPPHLGALLVTPHVDDEKPLWVSANQDSFAHGIGKEKGQFVTSGAYWLTPAMLTAASAFAQEGGERMRALLQRFESAGLPLKLFVVAKTLDIDHPSDLEAAATFLGD